jgi:hypothetical protein
MGMISVAYLSSSFKVQTHFVLYNSLPLCSRSRFTATINLPGNYPSRDVSALPDREIERLMSYYDGNTLLSRAISIALRP